jgi:hypothetical protein
MCLVSPYCVGFTARNELFRIESIDERRRSMREPLLGCSRGAATRRCSELGPP